MDVESVPFNKGFYSVDITFFFSVMLDVYSCALSKPICVEGLSIYSKKVILYGSEGNAKVFSSDKLAYPEDNDGCCCNTVHTPTATVQVASPICLACNLCECHKVCHEHFGPVPHSVARRFEGEFGCCQPKKIVCITIGVFSIVNLKRDVQMMVPVYDFSVPDRDCTDVSTIGDPCELFRRIKFPVDDFFPPKLSDVDCETFCCCD